MGMEFPFSADDKGSIDGRHLMQTTHESFARDEASAPGSDRSFGIVLAGCDCARGPC